MKKVLAFLLAAVIMLGSAGCGNSGETKSLAPESSSEVSQEEPTPEPTEEPAPEPTEEPTPTPEPEAKGLMFLNAGQKWGANPRLYEIYCLDPDTGATSLFTSFLLPTPEPGAKFDLYGARLNRYLFSDDYSKMNVFAIMAENSDQHVGWVDTQGNFFDVTEALGLQRKSDFDDPVDHKPEGFANGCIGFGYNTSRDNVFMYVESYVPVDNPVPEAVQEGSVRSLGHSLAEDDKFLGGLKSRDITSWIDDHRAIVNVYTMAGNVEKSIIVDTDSQTEIAYIPGDSRYNSYGVASPDGTQIAFMSKPKNGSGGTDIYITSVDGGDPVKVDTSGCPFDLDSEYCILIDWR